MSLRTIAIWLVIPAAAIITVGYNDPGWMLQTFLIVCLLWGVASIYRRWSDKRENAKTESDHR